MPRIWARELRFLVLLQEFPGAQDGFIFFFLFPPPEGRFQRESPFPSSTLCFCLLLIFCFIPAYVPAIIVIGDPKRSRISDSFSDGKVGEAPEETGVRIPILPLRNGFLITVLFLPPWVHGSPLRTVPDREARAFPPRDPMNPVLWLVSKHFQ